MPANVLIAMETLAKNKTSSLPNYGGGYKIGINSIGARFEEYIKDLLTGKINYSNDEDRLQNLNQNYYWLGSQNNPPDAISKELEAYEIKKIESLNNALALNSSPPKDMLYYDDPRIASECKKYIDKNWVAMDLFYVVGWVKNGEAKAIFFVQGKVYAASPAVYKRIAAIVSEGAKQAINNNNLKAEKTSEIARIIEVDPLRRTKFRVRGMWEILNPASAFSKIINYDDLKNFKFSAYAILEENKYYSYGYIPKDVNIKDSILPNPNNPADIINAKVLTVKW
ncbi:MAG: NgoPII family restriction endonuclease [Candidatus Micrarchaeia archaeon]